MEISDSEGGEKAEVQIGVADTQEIVPDALDTPTNRPQQTEKPTEPKPTQPEPTEPVPTELKQTEPKPTQPPTGGTKVEAPGNNITFVDYESMSKEEQMLFYYSFADADAFFEWYNAAKAEYEAGRGDIIIGNGGVVDLG